MRKLKMEKDQEMLIQRKILGMGSVVEVVPPFLLEQPRIQKCRRGSV